MSIQSNFPAIKPSLLLDFANTKQLDNRVTFTRSTPAVYYDGRTTTMAEQNLVTYSQEFDNAIWAKQNVTITANSTTAPDGTTTADTVTQSAGTSLKYFSQLSSGYAGKPYTASIYAKAGTNNFIQFLFGGSNTDIANFDISSGTVGTTSGITSATITSVGSGWYRCVVSWNSLGTDFTSYAIAIIPSSTSGRAPSTSDTNTVYLWGAQLEQRSSATAFTATTTQPITNYIPVLLTAGGNQPRFDCNPTTGESLGLLIEEQRTNLLAYSTAFNLWSYSLTWYLNQNIAPDGSNSATVLKGTGLVSLSASSVTAGTYTFSVYAKAYWSNDVRLNIYTGTADIGETFNLTTGAASGGYGTRTTTSTSAGNGWWRLTLTVATTTTTLNCQIHVDNTNTIFAWGAQAEAGAFATSYIATTSASATRTQDVASMTGTNFSSWYNNAEWTLYTEAAWTNITDGAVVSIDDNSFNAVARVTVYETGLAPSIYSNNAFQFNVNTQLPTIRDQFYKTSFAAKANNFAAITNTNAIAINNSGVLFNSSPFQMLIGRSFYGSLFTGRIKKIAYYPIRVSDTNLQALTS